MRNIRTNANMWEAYLFHWLGVSVAGDSSPIGTSGADRNTSYMATFIPGHLLAGLLATWPSAN
jgi:hypothetical protein